VTVRGLVFVPTAGEAPPPRQGTAVVVLDTSWTPAIGDRPDLIAARQVLGRVVERVDLFDGALAIVDRWAEATSIADTLTVEGTTYWYRLRETMWRWVHERLLWRGVIIDLERQGRTEDVRLDVDEPALADMVRARWPALATEPRADAPADTSSAVAPAPSLVARFARRLRGAAPPEGRSAGAGTTDGSERERREAILAARAEALADSPRPRVMVLTNPGTHQRIGAPDGERRDPLIGAVIPGLAERGYQPVLFATGLDQRRDDDWALIEDDERFLPQYLTATRWSRPEDDERAATAVESMLAVLDRAAGTPLDLDGLDLSTQFVEALRSAATEIVRTDVRMLARIERLIGELGPSAIVLAQEGIRTPWLMAGRRAGIPVLAVQHGVLYAGHAGYPNRRHPALCLADRTCVYGAFERDVLLDLAYEPEDVVVTGSPRLDLDTVPPDPDAAAAERAAVRRELGVAGSDRLLLVSTVNLRFVQRSHFAHMLEALLGAPLPGVHVVFKQHPGERDEGPYRDLVVGLARAGSYEPPPISVVKDIDLYRVLRAADAHIGLLSTVLTEAVVTGTPNLIALTDGHTDLLGYVEAGVARPVRTPYELLAALDAPIPTDPLARQAFLDRHFRRGDASGRIIDQVEAAIGARSPQVVA
jgi:hypothetical protein